MYDLVDRYLRKLDQELYKFKMELEADNAGITEILEKRMYYKLYYVIYGFLKKKLRLVDCFNVRFFFKL